MKALIYRWKYALTIGGFGLGLDLYHPLASLVAVVLFAAGMVAISDVEASYARNL